MTDETTFENNSEDSIPYGDSNHTNNENYEHTELGDDFGGANNNEENFVASSTKRGRLVGFLVSFSGNKYGQYWPLCFGSNKIGRNGNNNIVLEENSVSGSHANLKVAVFNNELDYSIWVTSDSQFIKVNGRDIKSNTDLVDNSKILIGGYEFLLVKINAEVHNLGLNSKFKSTKSSNENPSNKDFGEYDYTNLGNTEHRTRG